MCSFVSSIHLESCTIIFVLKQLHYPWNKQVSVERHVLKKNQQTLFYFVRYLTKDLKFEITDTTVTYHVGSDTLKS
jgi:hypothetical protein